ncbi:MAG: peptidoglycan DD-metalloendopeptidase family protein [Candidatus Omnitrophica bacterium]|nr:peptidoglycan DD-metalloendopeptidase family protein [Candidatus Omnitrophota bacterium]
MMRFALLALLIVSLAGCATAPRASQATVPIATVSVTGTPGMPNLTTYHTVKSGETLWRISKMYGVDIGSLAQANSLSNSTLKVGQRLVIPSPSARVREPVCYAAVKESFAWPVRGTVISRFGTTIDKARNKGIDIRAAEGSDVRASRAGKVVFCDDKLKGFGKTVILDHGDDFQTVYAYNSRIVVTPGTVVAQNDVIAKAGATGRAKQPSVHFEIRKDGEPQNPFFYLPSKQ